MKHNTYVTLVTDFCAKQGKYKHRINGLYMGTDYGTRYINIIAVQILTS